MTDVIDPPSPRESAQEWKRLGFLASLVVVSRLPAAWLDTEINVDESNLLAQAMRYATDLVPWRSADGTSSGPINSWFLLGAHRLGMPLGYTGAHSLAALILVGVIVGTYLATRRWFGQTSAWSGAVVATIWIAFNPSHEFMFFSSELVPVLLMSLALACNFHVALGRITGGILLGLVPWAKLQATPIAGLLGAWLMVDAIWPRREAGEKASTPRWRPAIELALAALAPTAGMLVFVHWGGAWDDWWNSYILGNKFYAGPLELRPLLGRTMHYVITGSLAAPWLLCLLAAAAWTIRRCETSRLPWNWRGPGTMSWALLGVAVFACARSPFEFPHYQILLLQPMQMATAAVVGRSLGKRSDGWRLPAVLLSGLLVYAAVFLGPTYNSLLRIWNSRHYPSEATITVAWIQAQGTGRKTIAVWGWFPSLYVENGQAPPTRHAITHFLNANYAGRDFLRASYMRDLVASAPDVVVDASGTKLDQAWNSVPVAKFPALANYVRDNFGPPRKLKIASGELTIYWRKTETPR